MDTAKRTYELTYVLSGTLTDNEITQLKSQVEQLLKKFKVDILKNEDWGRKNLAYTIVHEGKKQNEGVYTHVVFDLEPEQAPVFERELYLMNIIIRHLLVVSEGIEVEAASE